MKILICLNENGSILIDDYKMPLSKEGYSVYKTYNSESNSIEFQYVNNSTPLEQQVKILGKTIMQKSLENSQLKEQNKMLGQQIIDLDLRLSKLEAGNENE